MLSKEIVTVNPHIQLNADKSQDTFKFWNELGHWLWNYGKFNMISLSMQKKEFSTYKLRTQHHILKW